MPRKHHTSIPQHRAYVYRISLCSLLATLMLALGYLESRIPVIPPVPGMKLGLSNAVLLYAVYWLPLPLCVGLMLIKVLLSALLFGNFSALTFSLGGGALSLCAMLLSRRFGRWGVLGVSVIGAVAHNLGQLLVFLLWVGNTGILYYGAALLLAGTLTGMLTGTVAGMVFHALKKSA